MASNYWIKLYHEIIDDPKMMKMSEVLFSRCIKLFLLAGDHGQDGDLPPLEDAAWRLRIPEEELESDLIELQRVGITAHQDGVWSIAKWEERQGPMTSTERVRRHRARKQRQRHIQEYKERGPADVRFGNDDETAAERNVTQDKEEIKKRREQDKDSSGGSRRRTKRDDLKLELEKHFSQVTGNPVPNRATKKQQRAAAVRWWNPLIEIAGWFDDSLGPTKEHISATVKAMRSEGLSTPAPQSIVEVARDLYGRNKMGGSGAVETDEQWRERVFGD